MRLLVVYACRAKVIDKRCMLQLWIVTWIGDRSRTMGIGVSDVVLIFIPSVS